MGWASESFQRELARSGIFPINNSSPSYSSPRTSETKKKKSIHSYYNYSFPTEAQVRALNFITSYTGVIFEGRTKEEAKSFIAEYIEYAKEEANNG